MINHPEVTKHIIEGGIYWKYQDKYYPDRLTKRNAMENIKEMALTYCKGKGLDIGAGRFPLSGAIPIRNEFDQNAYNLSKYEDNSLDYIFSSHCLEHLDRPFEAIDLWITKLKKYGILFFYLPHIDMILWRPGKPWGTDHKWSPTNDIMITELLNRKISIVALQDYKDTFWSWYIIGRKL